MRNIKNQKSVQARRFSKESVCKFITDAFARIAIVAAIPAATPALAQDYSVPGPHAPAKIRAESYTIYYPASIHSSTTKSPVIIWGNGTFGIPPIYSGLLKHWASHGFVVVAANTMHAGSGKKMSAGIDYIVSQNTRKGSPFFQKIDVNEIGVSGHSQGGIGAVNVAINDTRISTVVPIQGLKKNEGRISIPIFAIAGSTDFIISPRSVREIFTHATGPAVYGELLDASHLAPIGTRPGPELLHYTTAWFRLYLLNETALESQFYQTANGIQTDSKWKAEAKNSD